MGTGQVDGGTVSPALADFLIIQEPNKAIIDQLKKFSLDDNDTALSTTSDRKRFGEGSFEAWYQKGRTLYILEHKGDEALAAIVWFGPKPVGKKSMMRLSSEESDRDAYRGDWHTISFRSYQPYRGKGLMGDFVGYAMNEYKKRFPEAKLWAGTDTSNIGSQRLLEKIGFHASNEYSDMAADWLVLTKA